jgi:rod shape-determining protein MreD
MRAILIAVPFLGILVILQSSIVSRVTLLSGTADLVLLALLAWAVQERVKTTWQWGLIGGLLVALVSALPLLANLVGYLISAGLARGLRRQLWQLPLFAMLVATFTGTLVIHSLTIFSLRAAGTIIPWREAFNIITLPSALLNLLLAIPVYAIVGDLAGWLHPEEIEI